MSNQPFNLPHLAAIKAQDDAEIIAAAELILNPTPIQEPVVEPVIEQEATPSDEEKAALAKAREIFAAKKRDPKQLAKELEAKEKADKKAAQKAITNQEKAAAAAEKAATDADAKARKKVDSEREKSAKAEQSRKAKEQEKVDEQNRKAAARRQRIVDEENALRLSAQVTANIKAYDAASEDVVELPKGNPFGDINAPFLANDVARADRFITWSEGNARYCPDIKKWLIWRGHHWAEDQVGAAINWAGVHSTQMIEVAGKLHSQTFSKEGFDMGSVRNITPMLQMARVDPRAVVRKKNLNADGLLLGVLGGVVDLKRGEHRAGRKEDLITKRAGTHFDASATCPIWENFLSTAFRGNEEMLSYIQRWAGYSLTGLLTEHAFIFLYGHGRNGKTTIIETLYALMGEHSQAAPQALLVNNERGDDPKNDLSEVAGVRFLSGSETEQGALLAENRVKSLTGGETVRGRAIYEKGDNFKAICHLWIVGNHKPRLKGVDDGIWSRIHLVLMDVFVPLEKRDLELPAKLLAELPGILNWAIKGCLEWQKTGLKMPQSVYDAVSEYRKEEDPLEEFFGEYMPIPDKHSRVSKTEMFGAYKDWARNEGLKNTLTQKAFSKVLRGRGMSETRSGDTRYWTNVPLPPPLPDDVEEAESLNRIYGKN